jgi:hypothetical protein
MGRQQEVRPDRPEYRRASGPSIRSHGAGQRGGASVPAYSADVPRAVVHRPAVTAAYDPSAA